MKTDKSADNSQEKGDPASDIQVAVFRQIHHLPLVWQGDGFEQTEIARKLTKNGWHEIKQPLRALADEKDRPDPDAFNEVIYFHDFAREFLYPHGDKPSFCLFEKPNPGSIEASFGKNGGIHKFDIRRLTLHVFHTKTAIMTVETEHQADEKPLTLAQVQTIIDRFRRSYTSYWDEDGPAVVPNKLCLSNGTTAKSQSQKDIIGFFENNRSTGADAPLLEPWKSWMHPLDQKDWRDPSDERVPVMSFILLEKTSTSNREILNEVRESDWYRLAEADGSGEPFAYNPDFLASKEKAYFYDRFMPDGKMDEDIATRHIFGGAHYSLVSVDGWFTQNIINNHFRRHYEKMALTVRFEYASLLAFSSRITNAVKPLYGEKTPVKSGDRFRREILAIHQDFLEFTHRYHFTGISSQIQAGEMFDHWRASLDLDRLYQDVKDEITSASEYAQAIQADRKSGDANALAGVAVLVGALVSAPSLNTFPPLLNLNSGIAGFLIEKGWSDAAPWVSFFIPFILVAGTASAMFWYFRRRAQKA